MSESGSTADDVRLPGSAVLPETVLAVLNGIPGMVGYWDRDLRNRLANSAYVEFFGVTPEQMVGMHIRDLLGEAVFEANSPHMQEALAGREATFDRTLTDVEGRVRYVQASYIPDWRDGAVVGFFVLVTDISARVVAEQRMAQTLSTWRALARSLPSGFVLVFDDELRFRVADGVELAAFGTTRESLEGRTLHEVATSALAQEVEPFFRAALAGETVSWERALGHRTFKFTAGPVVDPVDAPPDPDTGRTGIVVALDITAQRLHERTWAALHAVATDVANKCTPSEIAEHVAVSLVAVFGGDTSVVVRYTGQTTADVIAMAPLDPETAANALTFAPGDASIVARVHESREPVLTRYDEDGGSIARQATYSGFRTGAGAPIRYRGELWGAIALASRREDALGESVLTALTRFAQLVELAIGTTESWDTLLREAQLDDLTGLANRRTFHAHLKREVERAARHERPLSLAMLDLDHFKRVNDRHGHAVGDAVLAGLGKRLRAMCREGELVARLGGEEFAWIMPETSGEAAAAAAERLRQDVSSLPFPGVGVLQVSIGVCSLQPSLDPDGLLSRADEALYAAKRSGRDRVTIWEPRPAPL